MKHIIQIQTYFFLVKNLTLTFYRDVFEKIPMSSTRVLEFKGDKYVHFLWLNHY